MMQPQTRLASARAGVWWRMTRPHTLTASVVPVVLGTALAAAGGDWSVPLFLAMLAASVLIQTATNMFNEYYDYVKGLDNEHSVGIGGTIVRDGVRPKTVRNLAFLFYAVSVLLGVYICMESSWWVAAAGAVSMAVGYFYTAGPLPISYTPFGELFAGFFMGPVIIMIASFIQTGALSMDHFLISIAPGLLIAAINLANNIRDLDGDKAGGRRTLAILLGRPRAVRLLEATFAAAFAWTALLAALNVLTPWALLALLAIPKAVQAVRRFRGKTAAAEMMPAMKATAQLNTVYGLLLCAGIALSAVFS